MKEFNFETIVAPPEFERHCDNFVQAVKDKVSGKYRYLSVRPLNITTIQLEALTADIKKLKEKPFSSSTKDRIDQLYSDLHKLDVATATNYVAMVGLYGNSRNHNLVTEQIFDATDDLDVLAMHFHGRRIYPTLPEDLVSDIQSSIPHQTSIFYQFSDRQGI